MSGLPPWWGEAPEWLSEVSGAIDLMRTLIARPSCAVEPFRALGRTHSGSAVLSPSEPAVQHSNWLRSNGSVMLEPRPTKKVLPSIKILPHNFIVTVAK
jgi:hypothetical protein